LFLIRKSARTPCRRRSTPRPRSAQVRARITFAASATGLDRSDDHADALRRLATDFTSARTRSDLVETLRANSPHVVYLYCRGALDPTQPYLLVCAGDDRPFARAHLHRRMSWSDSRPFGFVNGCHTTAVRPD